MPPGRTSLLFFCSWILVLIAVPCSATTVTDGLGRSVVVPDALERVICSGPGCLRLLSYLQAQHLAVAVDSVEKTGQRPESRPYALANPQFKDLPLFGEGRGLDNPERIAGLKVQPQVIFKTYAAMGHDPQLLQDKTGIPVVCLAYGNLVGARQALNDSLRLMGLILGRQERAEAVIAFLDATQRDLQVRTRGIPEDKRPRCYVGGVAMRGGLGLQSTDPAYAPFVFLGARNVAAGAASSAGEVSHASVSREQIVAWDPEVMFLDLSTLQFGPQAGGLHELRSDPAYAGLRAVTAGRVFGVLPCNAYAQNFDAVLADAYFVGKALYPERFAEVDPARKADDIFTFLLGKPLFESLRGAFDSMVFAPVQARP